MPSSPASTASPAACRTRADRLVKPPSSTSTRWGRPTSTRRPSAATLPDITLYPSSTDAEVDGPHRRLRDPAGQQGRPRPGAADGRGARPEAGGARRDRHRQRGPGRGPGTGHRGGQYPQLRHALRGPARVRPGPGPHPAARRVPPAARPAAPGSEARTFACSTSPAGNWPAGPSGIVGYGQLGQAVGRGRPGLRHAGDRRPEPAADGAGAPPAGPRRGAAGAPRTCWPPPTWSRCTAP